MALDDSYSLKDFLSEIPYKYHIIPDGRYSAQGSDVRSYPTHVVLDRNSKIVFHTTGFPSNGLYWLEKYIKEGLSQSVAVN